MSTNIVRKVSDLAKHWQVSKNWVRNEIKQGRLIAKNISRGSRPDYRVDAEEADRFWKSLSNLRPVKQRAHVAIAAPSSSFEDFIK